MGPAQAMGTFLRVWRAEWAGLSRAQLAIAVGAASPKVKKVTPKVIRRWEEGQPPKTTEEFEALCAVMARQGLARPEVQQFRHAVFSACLDRQYPEVFETEDLAYRKDIDERARAVFDRCLDASSFSEVSVVDLVAAAVDVERALTGGTRRAVTSQTRRQEAALVCLRAGLRKVHSLRGRPDQAAAIARVNAEAIEATWGPEGLDGGRLSALAQRHCAALSLAKLRPSAASARRLFDVSDEAWARGKTAIAIRAFLNAKPCYDLGHLPDSLARARPDQLRRHLQEAQRLEDRSVIEDVHYHLAHQHLTNGQLADAEQHLMALERWQNGPSYHQCVWHASMGALAREQGDFGEATQLWGHALALAERHGLRELETSVVDELKHCEGAGGASGRRKARPSHSSRRANPGRPQPTKKRNG